jgi:macrolide-specific efflux system membrane fusion protein
VATVVVIDASGGRETREVSLGLSDRISAEVLEGLEEGERVIAGYAGRRDSAGPRLRIR